MSMALTYLIVDSFSIVFLLILFISTRERSERLTETRCFRAIVIMTAVALLCDMLAWQFDGQADDASYRYILWIVNIACYVVSGAMPLCWLYYTGLKLNRLSKIPKPIWLLISLPAIFLTAMSIATPWTRLLFYIDASNTYIRGPLFAIQIIIPFGYILAAAIWAMGRAGNERLRQQRNENLSLASFIIFPIVGGILQFVKYGISISWPCTALSLMLVYVSMQNQKISLDALTGLNNRGQFYKHLYGCIEHSENALPFALFMLDIDDFKKINDEFGHTAGDAALIEAANILKNALSNTNAFLARYGGDEFAVVLYYSDEKQLEQILKNIDSETEKRNNSGLTPYRIIFSVGYVCYDFHRYSNYQDMITAADAHMYMQKRQHKALRK